MACGQNPFYHSKSPLDAAILNPSLQSEESYGLHVNHTENGYISRDIASEENFTSGLSCLNSVETVLHDARRDGGNPVFSLNDQPNDDKDLSSGMDENSYQTLEPVLLTLTSLDCYSDISSSSEKDLDWISDVRVEKSSDRSEYQMFESTKDMLIRQIENSTWSFDAGKVGSLEGRDEVLKTLCLDMNASDEEDKTESDCSNTVMEGDGQGEMFHLKLDSESSNQIDGEYENVYTLTTGEDPNEELIIQNSNLEAVIMEEAVCGLDFLSARQKMDNEKNKIREDGELLKEEFKMAKSVNKHDAPENLSNHTFEKSAHDGIAQYETSEKKLDIGSNIDFLQSCFDMISLDPANEPEPNVVVCGAAKQIHHDCEVNSAQTPGPTTSQMQDAVPEEPPSVNTCGKAQVSPEHGQKNARGQITMNVARSARGNGAGAFGNVLLLASNEFMQKLQPVVLVQTPEWGANDGNAYQCSVCQHATQDLDEVIEHHHYKHVQHGFNYCYAYGCNFSTETLAVQHFCRSKHPHKSNTPKKPVKKLDPIFMCQYCNKPFVRRAAHHEHERRHIVVTHYRCKRCGLYFPQNNLLNSHRQKTKCTPLLVDPFAQLNGRSTKDLGKQKRPTFKREDDGAPLGNDCFVKLVDITKDCPQDSGQSSEHQGHLDTRADIKPFKCDECKMCFKYSWNLDHHKRKQCPAGRKPRRKSLDANRGSYACPICSHVYLYPQNVTRHLQKVCLSQHTGSGKGKVGSRYKCPLCDETFSMSYNRTRHIKKTCFQAYKTKVLQKGGEVKKEKEETSPPPTTPQNSPWYPCKLCPAWFAKRSEFSEHMKKHEGSQRSAASQDKPDAKGPSSGRGPQSEEMAVGDALTCQFCEKRFTSGHSLKKHLRLHKGNKPYRCLECGKNFKAHRHMMSHKNVHRRKIQCTVCKKIVPTFEDLLKHRQSHVNKGLLQCPDCQMQFRFPVFFLRHVATHERKGKMKTATTTCDGQLEERQVKDVQETKRANKSVPKSTGTPAKFRTKAQEVKEDNFCAVCRKTFYDSKALSRHCQTHVPPSNVLKCPFCVPDHHFTNRTALIRHIRLHTGEKPFSCQRCGVRFRRKDTLKSHVVKCDGPAETSGPPPASETEIHDQQKVNASETEVQKKFSCSYCPYVFSKRFNLHMHEKAHKANNLLPCLKCGWYYKRNKLYKHGKECKNDQSHPEKVFSNKNGGTRPAVKTTESEACKTSAPDRRCPHCIKRFRYRSQLIRHLRTHSNKKRFKCKHCLQKFAGQNSYLEHEQSCNKAKPSNDCKVFKCDFCTKAFSTPKYLRRHVLIHNAARPHKCDMCELSFSRHDHLKRHKTTCKAKREQPEARNETVALDHVDAAKQTEVQPSSQALECSICSKTFSRKYNLTKHVALRHSSSAPFSCRKCAEVFNALESLRSHSCTAHREKPAGQSSTPKETPPGPDVAAQSSKELSQLLRNDARKRCPGSRPLQCEYCLRQFKFPSQLSAHVIFHTGEKPFKCADCDELFARGDYLKRHLSKCSGKRVGLEVLCKSCGGLFPREALGAHQADCGVAFQSTERPREEGSTENSSKVKAFSCAGCNEHFPLFSQSHVASKHGTGEPRQSDTLRIKDEAVDEGYSENLSPNERLNKPFKCQQCDLSFLSKNGLSTHSRVHTAQPLSCKKCNKEFWSKFLQKKHARKCRDVLKKECDSSELDHKQHDKVLVFKNGSSTTGTGVLQTRFSCKDQDNGETDKGDAVHKYQCSECNQSFTDGLRLLSHLEAHRREDQERQRHGCNYCEETFDQAGLLRTHVRTHHPAAGDNTCPKCSKSFRFPSDLVLHQVCHDPKRPFVCDKCECRYWSLKALGAHERVAHPISEPVKTTRSAPRNSAQPPNVFTCDPCNKIYTNKQSFLRHRRKKHGHSESLGEPEGADVEQQSDKNESSANDGVDVVSPSDDDDDCDSDSAPYFPCHVCGKTFLTSGSLEDHQRCHLGEKPHECEECGKCFFQLVNLQQHQRCHKSEFQCQMCGKGFVSLFALRKHRNTHGRKRPHQCSKCALTFTKSTQLTEHMTSHRNENFPCDVCHENFSCKASRAEHRKIHGETDETLPPLLPPAKQTSSASDQIPSAPHERGYFCQRCQVRFAHADQLSEHRCNQENERQYACTECSMNFQHGSHLKKHQLTHQLPGTRSFRCNTCHMSFSHRSHFLTHLQTHGRKEPSESRVDDVTSNGNDPSQEKMYKCPICPESFDQALELANHLSVHSHMCNVCSKTFGTKQQLEMHEQSHLSAATQYECTECNKSFLGSDAFRQHYCANKHSDKPPLRASQSPLSIVISDEEEVEVDVGEDFYNCPSCNKRFSSSSSLLDHQKLHEAERPFKCLVCAKDFTQKKYLKKHQEKHDERPYQCDQCPESFKTDSAFASHRKTHDARRYHCSMCNRSYQSAYNLEKHEKKHREWRRRSEGGDEHRCDMCYKTFGLLSELQHHQESHVGQVVYECTECDKAFSFLNLLVEHQQTHAMAVDSFQNPTGSSDVIE